MILFIWLYGSEIEFNYMINHYISFLYDIYLYVIYIYLYEKKE